MAEKPKHIFEFYRSLFSRHPFVTAFVILGYAFVASFLLLRSEFMKPFIDRDITEARIDELEKRISQQDAVIQILTKRSKSVSFFRDLDFEENWKTDENRDTILRLLEYANFAIQRADYSRAESLYLEASQIQETISVPYYRSRMYYVQGDLQSAELQLRRVIELDKLSKYPDVRLYLGIVLYQMGKEKDGREYLRDFVNRQNNP